MTELPKDLSVISLYFRMTTQSFVIETVFNDIDSFLRNGMIPLICFAGHSILIPLSYSSLLHFTLTFGTNSLDVLVHR